MMLMGGFTNWLIGDVGWFRDVLKKTYSMIAIDQSAWWDGIMETKHETNTGLWRFLFAKMKDSTLHSYGPSYTSYKYLDMSPHRNNMK